MRGVSARFGVVMGCTWLGFRRSWLGETSPKMAIRRHWPRLAALALVWGWWRGGFAPGINPAGDGADTFVTARCPGRTMRHPSYDLVVIGSGPAGQKAALNAAKLGKRVAVIEREHNVGGVCIHTGTIPSKAIREAVLHLTGLRE